MHDGAQQTLVGLALRIRMLRAQLTRGATDDVTPQLDEAETALRTALAELRDLAHGIFPAVLADEGLAAALETLAESHPTRVRLDALPTERFESPVETAAYIVVAESLERLEPTHARVRAARAGSQLVVEVEMDGNVAEPLTHLEDRIGALDGRLSVVA
ncbi:MAG: sensor histidine kinase, partial [Gaiellaceae bacterium]